MRLGLGWGAVGCVWPVYTVTAGSWTSVGGLQRQEDPHGWSDDDLLWGAHGNISSRGGVEGGLRTKTASTGFRGPVRPGAPSPGGERVEPVRITGWKQPAPGGPGEQTLSARFQGPSNSVIKTSKVVTQCFKKKNDAKIHNDPHQNLKWSQNQCCWWAPGALVWASGKPC